MSKLKQGTLEKVKTAKGSVWYLRYTVSDGAKVVRPRVRIGLVSELPSKKAAWRAAEPILRRLNATVVQHKTFGDLLDRYEDEAMPKRHATRRGYLSMINVHIRPRWGKVPLEDVKAYEVRAWLMGLECGSRRKGSIHGMMRVLFRFAMLWEWLPLAENPMRLFSIKGATKRAKRPGVLTGEQCLDILKHIDGQLHKTMAFVAICTGLRISEVIGLKWEDIDFLGDVINIHRAVVENHVGEVKTEASEGAVPLDPILAREILAWRARAEFREPTDWVFASHALGGDNPVGPGYIQESVLVPAGKAIGLPFNLGWHTFRHTYRTLVGESGASMDVQRDLMRHADIHTTMQVYGGTKMEELRAVNRAVVQSLFGGKA